MVDSQTFFRSVQEFTTLRYEPLPDRGYIILGNVYIPCSSAFGDYLPIDYTVNSISSVYATLQEAIQESIDSYGYIVVKPYHPGVRDKIKYYSFSSPAWVEIDAEEAYTLWQRQRSTSL